MKSNIKSFFEDVLYKTAAVETLHSRSFFIQMLKSELQSSEKIPVSDGMGANADGIFEIFHTEGILDMSASFTDILNQEDEARQRLIFDAISESYKSTYGLDIVDIKCGGEPVITDYINYDDIVSEARAAFAVEETELPEFDAAYEEVE